MSENAKNSAAQNTIEDPPEYNAENINPKEGSDRLGRMGTGNISGEATYQQNGQSWLGGPQNGNETPREAYGSGSASGFLPENAKNPKDGSDWLGGPQNGNETPGKSDYTKHRFNETPSKSTEEAYQQNGQSWLGGPQNGNETPGEAYARNPQTGDIQKPTEGAYQQNGQSWLGGPQNGNEIPGNGGNGGNGGNASGNGGNGGNG